MSAPEPFEPTWRKSTGHETLVGLKIISAQLAYLIEHLVHPQIIAEVHRTYECQRCHNRWTEVVDHESVVLCPACQSLDVHALSQQVAPSA